MNKIILTLLIVLMDVTSNSAQSSQPIAAGKDIAVVQTVYGKVQGYIHNNIYTFKGIPYGSAERFMPPVRPLLWNGVLSTVAYGPVCPNLGSPVLPPEFEFAFNRNRGYYVNENCLTLNVWSNKVGNQKRPVMIWLHGGGFSSGSAVEFPSYNGESLSRKDVVVVSINHRLGVFGFLDLSVYGDQYKSSANLGVMDMILALTWVKENISGFGGDPDNVTIFGQSGGGAKVMCLMSTPSAKGLFHKAIVQSAGYLTRFIEPVVSKKVSEILFEELKLMPGQIESLKTIPAERLMEGAEKALAKVKATLTPEQQSVFGLEWEPVHDGTFLPYQPDEAVARELSKHIPMIAGSTKNEYMPFIPGSKDISTELAQSNLQQKYGDRTSAYMRAIKNAYPETIKPSDYIDVDFIFRPMVLDQANKRSTDNSAPVYVYVFAWQSPVFDGALKAAHCMDLPFMMNNVQVSEEMTGGGKSAMELADKMSEAWVQFARTGNPDHKGLPHWPAYTTRKGSTMIFDNVSVVKEDHDKELMFYKK